MKSKANILWLIPALGIAFSVWWFFGGQYWLAIHTGTDNCYNIPGPYLRVCKAYGFWSGFGSDMGEYIIVVSLISSLALFWRTHTCPAKWWCWRRPTHPLEGNEHYKLCSVHHPDTHMSLVEAIEHHCHLRSLEDALLQTAEKHRREATNG